MFYIFVVILNKRLHGIWGIWLKNLIVVVDVGWWSCKVHFGSFEYTEINKTQSLGSYENTHTLSF